MHILGNISQLNKMNTWPKFNIKSNCKDSEGFLSLTYALKSK